MKGTSGQLLSEFKLWQVALLSKDTSITEMEKFH